MDLLSGVANFFNDPIPKFFFGVMVLDNPLDTSLGGMALAASVAGLLTQLDPGATAFASIGGLNMSISTDVKNELGNSMPIPLPGGIDGGEITMKRFLRPRHIGVMGFSLDPFTGWWQDTVASAKSWKKGIKLKDMIVMVFHPHLKNPIPIGPIAAMPVAGFLIKGAYPTKCEVEDLDASANEPLTETFTFAYREIMRLAVPPM